MANALTWRASNRIFVNRGYMSPHWQSKSDIARIVGFMNRCLCVFYKAVDNIENTRDLDRGLAMRRELNEMATEGWGIGIQDFNDALEFLDQGRTRWTDENESRYSGGASKLFQHSVTAPAAFVNFAEALDDKLAQLASDLRGHVSAAQAVTTDANAGSWSAFTGNLGEVARVGNHVSNHLWLMDAAAFGRDARVRDFLDATSRYATTTIGAVTRFADVIGRIEAISRVHVEMQEATRGNEAASQMAEGITVMRAVVDFLPVLGDFYGSALDAIPALINSFRSSIELEQRRLDRASRGLSPSIPRPPACAICLATTGRLCGVTAAGT